MIDWNKRQRRGKRMIDKATGNIILDKGICIMPRISKRDFTASCVFSQVVSSHQKRVGFRNFFALEIQEVMGRKVCIDLFFKKNELQSIELYDAAMQNWQAFDAELTHTVSTFHKEILQNYLEIIVEDPKEEEPTGKSKYDIITKKEKRKKRLEAIEKQRIEQHYEMPWGDVNYIVDGLSGEIKLKFMYNTKEV